jgi:hypothetical protein
MWGATLIGLLSTKIIQTIGGLNLYLQIVGLCQFTIVPVWTDFTSLWLLIVVYSQI